MAQHFTDFSDATTGSGVPSDWTVEPSGGVDFEVVSDQSYEGGKAIQGTASSGVEGLASWDTVGDIDDVEVYTACVTDGTNVNRIGSAARIHPSDVTHMFGGSGPDDNDAEIVKWETGSESIVGSTSGDGTPDPRCRYRANGTDHKVKVWSKGNSEPSSWDVETTDSTITASDPAGILFQFVGVDSAQIEAVGVGTNGDTAPTAPVSNPPAAPTNLNATLQ